MIFSLIISSKGRSGNFSSSSLLRRLIIALLLTTFTLKTALIAGEGSQIVQLSFFEGAKVAIFSYRGNTYLAFDKLPQDNIMPRGLTNYLNYFTDSEHFTIKFKARATLLPEITTNGVSWQIDFGNMTKASDYPDHPVNLEVAQNKLQITSDSNTDPIFSIYEPIFEERLLVVASSYSKRRAIEGRDFVNFRLLKSFNGIAVKPVVDDLQYRRLSNKLTFDLLPFTFQPPKVLESLLPTTAVLVNFKEWVIGENFFLHYQALFEDILQERNEETKYNLRIKLVQLMLGHGLNYEALSYLEYMGQRYGEIKDPQYTLLVGVANYLNKNYRKAENAFKKLDFKNNQVEVNFWLDAANLQLNQEGSLKYGEFLKYYSSDVRHQFGFLALSSALKQNNTQEVEAILRSLAKDPDKKYIDQLSLFEGHLLIKKGKFRQGLSSYNKLIKKTTDNGTREKAELAKTKYLLDVNQIKKAEAIKILEGLRFSWRGGKFEAELLSFMADLYASDSSYHQALYNFKHLLNYYAQYVRTLAITAKMEDAFRRIFIENKLSDFKSVAIFYEFNELVPIDHRGVEIIQSVIDKLIALNELEDAITLLRHLIDYRLQGEERINSIIKLSHLHLQEDSPQEALTALELIKSESIVPAKIRTMIQLKRFQEASILLNSPSLASLDKFQLGSELLWAKSDWLALIKLIEPAVVYRNRPSRQLTEAEEQNIFRLSIAYIATFNTANLYKLYMAYFPIMGTEFYRTQLYRNYTIIANNKLVSLNNYLDIIKEAIKL